VVQKVLSSPSAKRQKCMQDGQNVGFTCLEGVMVKRSLSAWLVSVVHKKGWFKHGWKVSWSKEVFPHGW
jgi:hypothetical protein